MRIMGYLVSFVTFSSLYVIIKELLVQSKKHNIHVHEVPDLLWGILSEPRNRAND